MTFKRRLPPRVAKRKANKLFVYWAALVHPRRGRRLNTVYYLRSSTISQPKNIQKIDRIGYKNTSNEDRECADRKDPAPKVTVADNNRTATESVKVPGIAEGKSQEIAEGKPTINFGSFIVNDLLYAGRFSQVWSASKCHEGEAKDNRQFVIKFSMPEIVQSEWTMLKYIKDVAEATPLPPRHLAILVTICRANERLGFVFERAFCSLSSLEVTRRFSIDQILNVVIQIFAGLAALHHTYNIVHSDLKPDNILIHDTIKITDFGHAHMIKPSAIFSAAPCISDYIGYQKITSSLYRAPEIVLGDRRLNEKIDVWSAGVILFYLLTHGSTLFEELDEYDEENDNDDEETPDSFYMARFFDLFGSPPESTLQECVHASAFAQVTLLAREQPHFSEYLQQRTKYSNALDFLDRFWPLVFTYDVAARTPAIQAAQLLCNVKNRARP